DRQDRRPEAELQEAQRDERADEECRRHQVRREPDREYSADRAVAGVLRDRLYPVPFNGEVPFAGGHLPYAHGLGGHPLLLSWYEQSRVDRDASRGSRQQIG